MASNTKVIEISRMHDSGASTTEELSISTLRSAMVSDNEVFEVSSFRDSGATTTEGLTNSLLIGSMAQWHQIPKF